MTKKIATVKIVRMGSIRDVIQLAFKAYTLLLFLRIGLSYFPRLLSQPRYRTWIRLICFYTDPYLNFFRRLIPPIGGTIDVSPILGFIALRFIENLLLKFL